MPKIIHYRDKCIGCAICQEQLPSHWSMSKKDGKAVLIGGINKKGVYQLDITSDVMGTSREIAAACPVRIIKVLE